MEVRGLVPFSVGLLAACFHTGEDICPLACWGRRCCDGVSSCGLKILRKDHIQNRQVIYVIFFFFFF